MTLHDICESMRVGYAAKLVKMYGHDGMHPWHELGPAVFAFETEHGQRLLVERKDDKVAVYSFHTMLKG